MRPRRTRFGRSWRAPLLVCVFVSQLLVAILIHANTPATRRVVAHAISSYLSKELRGAFDISRIESLSSSRMALRDVVISDELHRRVATFDRILIESSMLEAVTRWLTRNEPLTLVVDSMRADGAHLRLHPDPDGNAPTLFSAVQPAMPTPASSSQSPYRVFLANVEIGDVSVDSAYSGWTSTSLRVRRVAGQLLINQLGIAASVKRFSLDAQDPFPTSVHAFGSLEFRSPRRFWGDMNLALGRVPCSLHVEYQKDSLELEVNPFKLSPQAAREWFPEWPVQQTVTLTLSAHGPLGQLGIRTLLSADATEVEAIGRLALESPARADLAILARSIDVKRFFAAPFASNLDGAVRMALEFEDAQPRVRFDGVVHPGYAAGFATPRVDIDGQFDSEGFMISGRSNDSQLPIRAAAVLRNRELRLDAQIDRARLEQALPERFRSSVQGTVGVRIRSTIKDNAIATDVDAIVDDLRTNGMSLRHAKLAAQFEGALSSPALFRGHLRLDSEETGLPPYLRFRRLSAAVTGSATQSHLELHAQQSDALALAVETDLKLLEGPALGATRFRLSRGDRTLSVDVARTAFSRDMIRVDDLRVTGSAGELKGDFGLERGEVFGALHGTSLDLDAAASLLGLPEQMLSGKAAVSLELDTRRRPAAGRAQVGLTHVALGPLSDVTGALELILDGDQLTTSLQATSNQVNQVKASSALTLHGSPLDVSSYEHATGKVVLELLRLRLDDCRRALRLDDSSWRARGTADIRVSAQRSTSNTPLSWDLYASTSGFGLSRTGPSGAFELGQIDWMLGAEYQGALAALRVDSVVRRNDQPKLSLVANATLPPTDELLTTLTNPGTWREIPFEAFLTVPRQDLADWSQSLSTPIGAGMLESNVSIKGPASQASLVLDVRATDLLLPALGNAIPFDLEGLLEHTPSQTRVLGGLGARRATWAQVNAVGNLEFCSEGLVCIRDWSGRAELGLLGLPLGVVPRLTDIGISGDVRGVLTARRSGGLTNLDAVLPVDNLRLSGQPLGQALLNLRSSDEELVAGAKLLDAAAQIDLEAHVPVHQRTLLPTRRDDSPIRIVAAATGYDAAVLGAWLHDYVEDLGGELSGRVDVTLASAGPARQNSKEPTPLTEDPSSGLAVNGYLTLNNGRGVLRSLDLGFSDLSIAAQAASTGSRTTISVPTISLSTGKERGHLRGSAVAEFEASSLTRLVARIDDAQAIPIPVNSVSVASLTAAADLEMTRAAKGFDATLDFEHLEVHLPRGNTRQIVGLGENPDIEVLQPLGPQAWQKARTRATTTYRIRLSLGRRAKVTRADMALPITGTPMLEFNGNVHPSGIIQLGANGRLELFGKSFVIDRGQVTLNPDNPSNPQLDVAATWRGPTHLVTARVQGTLNDARLRLSSDPPLPSEARVMALLLGGDSGSDSSAGAGLGVGATLFNELLSGTALSSVEVRTSSGDRQANYTAAVPLRENLWFEATYQSPTNTTLPGTSAQRGFSGTVDYRFRRNWSVRTEVGTLGAGADLVWQYRY